MVKKYFAFAAVAMLAACSTPTLTTATTIDEKLMFSAEAAYNAPAAAYVSADGNGLLTPAVKAKVKPLLVEAYKGLFVARCAYNFVNYGKFQSNECPTSATNFAVFKANADKAEALANQAKPLIPK